jgi:small-conductance mechanosensitive channel
MRDFLIGWRQVLDFPLFRAGGVQFTVGHLIELMVMLTVVWVAEMILRRVFLARLLHRSRLKPSVQFAITKIARYAFLVLGIYLSLQAVEINLNSLAFLAGALGVGVGFGLQNIVSNFISGLIILAEAPIALEDRVEVSGVVGRVTEINLRSTTLVTNDNIYIIIPNSNLITGTVVNWSHGDPTVRTRMPIGIAYGTDIEKVRTLLLEAAAAEPEVLKTPAPDVLFVGYGDSAINLELAVWSSMTVDQPLGFKSRLFYAIHETLEANKIEIPFPQRDLHLRSGTLVLHNGATATTAQITDKGM